ncbi:MAG: hypothetical protein LBP52_03025 [Burkholderiaceae bacterium]|nr:hypothetical protein [Burkholderiaceae bacterium]
MHDNPPLSKIFYRPIEAAIRWAGILRYKKEIISAMPQPWQLPEKLDCPRWSEFRLCMERIYDAILNGELPYGQNGITLNHPSLWRCPDLTVRHVDLKRWMREHYPEQRPAFLFSHAERIAHPVITLEVGQAMLIERRALKAELEQCRRNLQALQEQHDGLRKQSESIPACAQCPISDRAESTYLNIIGGMLDLMLGQSPSGVAYSRFRTQEAIVSALIAHHGSAMGIAERTLNGKFASARKKLRSMNC